MYDASPSQRPSTAIIGAGLAGLSAAVRLCQQGHRVTVIEATKAGGGRSRSFEDPVTGRVIDNGQHLMMGCYHETLAFLRAIGAPSEAVMFQRNMSARMLVPGGRDVTIDCPGLPAPYHLAAGLMGMRGVGTLHKLAALRAGIMLRSEVARPDDNETCDGWLRRMGQTQKMRSYFWEPLIWAVLNDDPLVASAAMLLAVLERAFMGTRDASRFGIPREDLSELYVTRSQTFLSQHGAEIRYGDPARELVMAGDTVRGVRLRSGTLVPADRVITAVPPHALLSFLPERCREHFVFRDVARLTYSPIINLWATLDRPLFDDDHFIGLVDSPLHWVFDRDSFQPRQAATGRLISVTISGARSFMLDPAASLRQLLEAELARFFPTRPVQVLEFRAIKEKRATISHAAGTYTLRPEIKSPLRGLYLAGDWVRTGLPATIESAVHSGHRAADLVVDDAKLPRMRAVPPI